MAAKSSSGSSATIACFMCLIIFGLTVATIYNSGEAQVDVDAEHFHAQRGGGASTSSSVASSRSHREKRQQQQQQHRRGVANDAAQSLRQQRGRVVDNVNEEIVELDDGPDDKQQQQKDADTNNKVRSENLRLLTSPSPVERDSAEHHHNNKDDHSHERDGDHGNIREQEQRRVEREDAERAQQEEHNKNIIADGNNRGENKNNKEKVEEEEEERGEHNRHGADNQPHDDQHHQQHERGRLVDGDNNQQQEEEGLLPGKEEIRDVNDPEQQQQDDNKKNQQRARRAKEKEAENQQRRDDEDGEEVPLAPGELRRMRQQNNIERLQDAGRRRHGNHDNEEGSQQEQQEQQQQQQTEQETITTVVELDEVALARQRRLAEKKRAERAKKRESFFDAAQHLKQKGSKKTNENPPASLSDTTSSDTTSPKTTMKKKVMNEAKRKEQEFLGANSNRAADDAAFGVGHNIVGGHHHHDAQYEKQTTYATKYAKPAADQPSHDYIFELDKPRQEDEEKFFFKPRSKGGVLKKPSVHPRDIDGDSVEDRQKKETYSAAHYLFKMFKIFDRNENANETMPVYGTMCVGRDCEYILPMIQNLKIGIGHFIVVVSTTESRWVNLFSHLQELFPGRFTAFHRPEKLSCAESWNLVVRMAFSIRPMIDQVFIANADWNPKPTDNPRVDNQMARYAVWSRTQLGNVLNRYMHFSSFSFTKKGYLELGYFDEVIYPALAEDVEFHIKAVSKGLGTLGLYDNWRKGSNHIHRASGGEKVVSQRHSRVARFDYILRKWNVRVPGTMDFAHSRPFKHPFDLPWIHHNNSWVVDPKHRQCAKTGEGAKMNSGRCYYDPSVLLQLLPPSSGEGDAHGERQHNTPKLPSRLTTPKDSFPGGFH